MAKKKQALSPEERLAAALVPEKGWPYALPDGWKWVYLSGILDVSKEKTEEFPPDTKYVGLENIEKDTGRMQAVDAEGIRSTKNIFEAGNILYGKLRPYLNKHGIAEFDGVCSTDILVFQTAPSVEKELLNRYFDLPQFISFAVSHSKGINLPRVSAKEILTARMPLPPLSEQRRLVARIESLFAKLDAAREKVQSVLDSHETRKAALLHDAFAGKLTAKWRDGQSTKSFSWKPISFEDCIEKMQNGLSKRKGDAGEYVNVLRLTNIAPEGLSFQDMRKILLTSDEKEKYKLAPEDVLMVRVNGSKDNVGKQLYIDKKDADNQLTFCDHLIRIHYNEQLVAPQFMVYFSHTMQYKSYVEKNMVSSAGQNTISRKGMKNLSLMLPSLPEQQQIVRILDRLLAREQRARQAAEETLTAIDRMKQSILARAFRGEL